MLRYMRSQSSSKRAEDTVKTNNDSLHSCKIEGEQDNVPLYCNDFLPSSSTSSEDKEKCTIQSLPEDGQTIPDVAITRESIKVIMDTNDGNGDDETIHLEVNGNTKMSPCTVKTQENVGRIASLLETPNLSHATLKGRALKAEHINTSDLNHIVNCPGRKSYYKINTDETTRHTSVSTSVHRQSVSMPDLRCDSTEASEQSAIHSQEKFHEDKSRRQTMYNDSISLSLREAIKSGSVSSAHPLFRQSGVFEDSSNTDFSLTDAKFAYRLFVLWTGIAIIINGTAYGLGIWLWNTSEVCVFYLAIGCSALLLVTTTLVLGTVLYHSHHAIVKLRGILFINQLLVFTYITVIFRMLALGETYGHIHLGALGGFVHVLDFIGTTQFVAAVVARQRIIYVIFVKSPYHVVPRVIYLYTILWAQVPSILAFIPLLYFYHIESPDFVTIEESILAANMAILLAVLGYYNYLCKNVTPSFSNSGHNGRIVLLFLTVGIASYLYALLSTKEFAAYGWEFGIVCMMEIMVLDAFFIPFMIALGVWRMQPQNNIDTFTNTGFSSFEAPRVSISSSPANIDQISTNFVPPSKLSTRNKIVGETVNAARALHDSENSSSDGTVLVATKSLFKRANSLYERS